MAVLVTGGAGYIGSHMVLGLLDAGDVLALDDLSTGFRWAVPCEAKFIEGNVGDHELVRSLMGCEQIDVVIHFAGSVVVPESVRDPLQYYRNNTCNSCSLIACAVDAEVPNFIFSSTAAVYGTSPSRRSKTRIRTPLCCLIIVAAILNGRYPPQLTANRLMDDTRLPLDWNAQRELLCA
jgi:UDP-glucose 4-epimerase